MVWDPQQELLHRTNPLLLVLRIQSHRQKRCQASCKTQCCGTLPAFDLLENYCSATEVRVGQKQEFPFYDSKCYGKLLRTLNTFTFSVGLPGLTGFWWSSSFTILRTVELSKTFKIPRLAIKLEFSYILEVSPVSE